MKLILTLLLNLTCAITEMFLVIFCFFVFVVFLGYDTWVQ